MYNSLLVAFSRGSAPSPKTDQLQKAVLELCPNNSAFVTTSAKERIRDAGRGYALKFSHTVSGDSADEAIQTLKKNSQDRRVVVVTLCEEMMKAAGAAHLPVITVGHTDVPLTTAHFLASPEHLPIALRSLDRPRVALELDKI